MPLTCVDLLFFYSCLSCNSCWFVSSAAARCALLVVRAVVILSRVDSSTNFVSIGDTETKAGVRGSARAIEMYQLKEVHVVGS